MTKVRTVTIIRKEVPKIKNKKPFNLTEFVRLSAQVRKIIEKEREEKSGGEYGDGRYSFGG